MNGPRILVAGVGNIFLGDDAFGVEVVRQLSQRPQPANVRVVDFGIRGLDLSYALLDGYDAVILIDALPRGEQPGTLYILEPGSLAVGEPIVEGHNLDPAKVLRLTAALGGQVKRLLVVGCEPESLADPEEMTMGLSETVRLVIGDAVAMVESLVSDILTEPQAASSEGLTW